MTPAYSIAIAGGTVNAILPRLLAEVRVTLTADRESDNVEIVLTDPVRELAEPKRGRTIAVKLGYDETGLRTIGEFVHSATIIDLAPRAVRIRGAATDVTAAATLKAPTTRAWHETTVGEIVETIAARHGLKAAVDAALASEAIDHIDQTSESDVHFLRRLARQYDATTKLVQGHVMFVPAGTSVSARAREHLPLVTIQPPAQGERKLLEGANIRRSDRSRYGSVRAKYYDLDEATHVYVVAGSGKPVYNLRDPYPDEAQAEAAATGRLAKLTRSTGRIDVTMPGNPAAVGGGRLTTEGWSGGEDGEWTIVRAVHTLAPASGYTTAVTAEAFAGD